MAKELFIVFLYDTEAQLREEEDPQTAVVFFHPSWVSANQRMALCGQLIGVTQFVTSSFTFPHTISLNNGKFALKRIGRFILCVGTDRNIPDWILEKRCEILNHTLQFFHADLNMFRDTAEQKIIAEKLINVMEVYLPVLLYAGNIFGNNLTIRLPKSAGSIFLEAAQVLECLQSDVNVYGGAVFYQNKIVMSQLSPDVTKQLVVTDPYRIKIPAESITTSFELPVGVQLIVVYVDEEELHFLQKQKVPSKVMLESTKNNMETKNICENRLDSKSTDRCRIFTVMEEESEVDITVAKSKDYLAPMPDIVKDTVRTKEDEEKNKFCAIKVESYIVDSHENAKSQTSCSNENLKILQNESVRYCSFGCSSQNSEDEDKFHETHAQFKNYQCKPNSRLKYYNTISDPVNPWFRSNGLPASKALRDDRISFYCHDIKNQPVTKIDKKTKPTENIETTENNVKRPTSIEFGSKDAPKKKSRIQKSVGLLLELKKEFCETAPQCPPSSDRSEVPLTPLMSKLSILDLSQRSVPATVLTPATSTRCLTDDNFAIKENQSEKLDQQMKRKSRRQKSVPIKQKQLRKRSVLFVFGHQNVSLYLLMEPENIDKDLIHYLWKTCTESIREMEVHLQKCMESIPQSQAMGVTNDSYSYLSIHSTWETLNHGGQWTSQQLHLLNTLHNDFDNDETLTNIIVRLDDSIMYGSQIADNQLFYQQSVHPIAGLPTPSDLMGTVALKAKRRLERDHGLLII